ncbi:MAG: hypothetical protein JNJ91_02180 [Flavobacteriales bacterium]|nr:hypothetical protein [Flavobacteriales bacterium]
MSTHTLPKGLERLSFPALIATAIAGLIGLAAVGQDDGQVYRILKVGGQETLSGYLTCWLDLAPDNNTVGLSSTQGFPYRIPHRWRGQCPRDGYRQLVRRLTGAL